MSIRWALGLAALLVAAEPLGQERIECDENWGWRGPRAHVCEIRQLTMPAGGALTVDGARNGSITVTGESRRDVLVRATIHAWAYHQAEAERIASAVNVRSDGAVRAEGPDQRGRAGFSVDYEVLAPRDIDLDLETHNGSIAIARIRGELSFEARNGSIKLDGVAGNVRGRTTNGGVEAELTGDTWDGTGLDLETTNGAVRLRVPESYSARLETGTVNGGIDIDFPVTVQGRIGREFSTTLGRGGPLVRAETTNGQVRISRGRGDLAPLQ